MGFFCIRAGTVTIPCHRSPSRPSWIVRYTITQGAPCVSLMVDKMVDVDVPLTMNCRAVNISKHKAQGCCSCLHKAPSGTPGAPITNPQPPAGGFLLAHPEDWFKPPFDQMRKHLRRRRRSEGLTNSRSAVSNPSRLSQRQPNSKPTAGFFIGSPRGLVRTPVRQNTKHFGRQRRSVGLDNSR